MNSPVPFYEVGKSSSQTNRIQNVVDLSELPQLLGVVHTSLKQRQFNNKKKICTEKNPGTDPSICFISSYFIICSSKSAWGQFFDMLLKTTFLKKPVFSPVFLNNG